MPINRHFDLIAPLYERFIPAPDPQRLISVLDLPSDGSIWLLDAAGGTGRVTEQLCPLVQRLVICDLSRPMLLQTRQKACVLPGQARVERLPFADNTFQRILVVDAFHHFGDQTGTAAELARVLSPGGRLVIEEPDIRRMPVKLIALGETLLLMGSHFRSPIWMRALLAGNGLETVIETEDATAWVIGTKPG